MARSNAPSSESLYFCQCKCHSLKGTPLWFGWPSKVHVRDSEFFSQENSRTAKTFLGIFSKKCHCLVVMESHSAPRIQEYCSTVSIFMVWIGCMYISACKESNIFIRKQSFKSNLLKLIRNQDGSRRTWRIVFRATQQSNLIWSLSWALSSFKLNDNCLPTYTTA